MEKILEIKEISNYMIEEKFEHHNKLYTYEKYYDGFSILTNKQDIKLLISNSQSCCESWGYFLSEDDLDYFIGANLLDIRITNTALENVKSPDVYEGDVMFVDLITSKGVLQFIAYNNHNGYYGHDALVISNQVNERKTL